MGRALRTGLVGLLLLVGSGCAGADCDGLPALQAQRDEARQDYVALGDRATAAQDDALHALERRAYDLEQSCG